MTWNPPYPTNREPSWVERSTWAMCDWERARGMYIDACESLGHPWRPDPYAHPRSVEHAQHRADEAVRSARAEYRHQILGWYAKLCLPLGPGEVVPNEVAKLQWEQWDIEGRDAADAVNL